MVQDAARREPVLFVHHGRPNLVLMSVDEFQRLKVPAGEPASPEVLRFLIAYHLYCGRLMRAFAEGRNTRSHVWYRYFNEIPVLVLFVVVFLVVLRPF